MFAGRWKQWAAHPVRCAVVLGVINSFSHLAMAQGWRDSQILSPPSQRYAAQAQGFEFARKRGGGPQRPPYAQSRQHKHSTQYNSTPYLVPQVTHYPVPPVTLAGFYEPLLGFRGTKVPSYGVQVLALQPHGVAARAGLEPGDIIVRVNGEPVFGPSCFQRILAGCDHDYELLVLDIRTGQLAVRWAARYPY